MLCPRCGTPNRAKAVRCLRCGSSLKGKPTAVAPTPTRPTPAAPSTRQPKLSPFEAEEATIHDADTLMPSAPIPRRPPSARPPISQVGFDDQTAGRDSHLDMETLVDPGAATSTGTDEWAELLEAARSTKAHAPDPADHQRRQRARAPTAAPVEPQVAVPAHRNPRPPPGTNTMRALAQDLAAPVAARRNSGGNASAPPARPAATPPATGARPPARAPQASPRPPAPKDPAATPRRRPAPAATPVADSESMSFVDPTKPIPKETLQKQVEATRQGVLAAQKRGPRTDDLQLSMQSMPVDFASADDEDEPPNESTRLGFLADPPSEPGLSIGLEPTPIESEDSRELRREKLQERADSPTSDEPLEVTRAFIGDLDPGLSMPGDPAPLGRDSSWSPAADRSDTAAVRTDTVIPRNDTPAVSSRSDTPAVSPRGPTATEGERLTVASLSRRLGSLTLDAVLLVALFLGLGVGGVLGEPWASIDLFEPDEVGSALVNGDLTVGLVIGLVLAFLYSLLCHGIVGRSVGKLIVGTKLVRTSDGEGPSWGQSALRALLAVPGALFAGVGLLWPLLSPRARTLHDIFSRTIVIRG